MKAIRPGSSMLKVKQLRTPGFLSWDGFDDSSPATVRRTSPYKEGDVIQWQDLDRKGKRVLRRGLIAYIRPEYQERAVNWLPAFLVRPERLDGVFAGGYVTVYPGDIARAEELDATAEG